MSKIAFFVFFLFSFKQDMVVLCIFFYCSRMMLFDRLLVRNTGFCKQEVTRGKMQPLKLGLFGAKGRMCTAIQAYLAQQKKPSYAACYLVIRPGSEAATNASLTYHTLDSLPMKPEVDAWIDFSLEPLLSKTLKWLHQPHVAGAYVLGVTGLTQQHHGQIQTLSAVRPVLYSPNMSLGIAVMGSVVNRLSHLLHNVMDIHVEECHHTHKKDRPSGTARWLAEQALSGWGMPPEHYPEHIYEGARPPHIKKGIGCVVHRRGQWTGNHSVHFSGQAQELSIVHKTLSREPFVLGALTAAKWLKNKKQGLYTMEDVLQDH